VASSIAKRLGCANANALSGRRQHWERNGRGAHPLVFQQVSCQAYRSIRDQAPYNLGTISGAKQTHRIPGALARLAGDLRSIHHLLTVTQRDSLVRFAVSPLSPTGFCESLLGFALRSVVVVAALPTAIGAARPNDLAGWQKAHLSCQPSCASLFCPALWRRTGRQPLLIPDDE
jgi:hypothetical protein